MLCRNCKAEINEGVKFCRYCGAAVHHPAPVTMPIMCRQCGSELRPGKKFCASCGTPVAALTTKPLVGMASEQTRPNESQPADESPQSLPIANQNRKGINSAIVIGMAVLVFAAVLIWFLGSGKGKGGNGPSPKETDRTATVSRQAVDNPQNLPRSDSFRDIDLMLDLTADWELTTDELSQKYGVSASTRELDRKAWPGMSGALAADLPGPNFMGLQNGEIVVHIFDEISMRVYWCQYPLEGKSPEEIAGVYEQAADYLTERFGPAVSRAYNDYDSGESYPEFSRSEIVEGYRRDASADIEFITAWELDDNSALELLLRNIGF